MRIGIIDCGTNTFNMLVAEVGSKKIKFLTRTKRVVKLGSQGITKGIIGSDGMNRAISALKDYAIISHKKNVDQLYAFGTAALRDAKNKSTLLNKSQDIIGCEIKLISGLEEARLIYIGVKNALEISYQPILIMDIGGGSVEFIIANNSGIFWKNSYRLGAARLKEIINPSEPIKAIEIKKIKLLFETELNSLFDAIEKWKPLSLIGSSGSFDTFASILLYQQKNPKGLRGKTSYNFDLSEYKLLHRLLLKSTYKERLLIPGMLAMRADMIVLASLLLTFVLDKSKIKKLQLSLYALKEGILFDKINKLGASYTVKNKQYK